MLLRALLLLTLTFTAILPTEAKIRIDLTNANAEPLPIAVMRFVGEGTSSGIGQQMQQVISGNFKNSALFNLVGRGVFAQDANLVANGQINFDEWQPTGADAVLSGTVTEVGNKIRVEFRLLDIINRSELLIRRYTVEKSFWRHIAHRISDDVYSELTGEGGYFATRIVHIGEQPSARGTIKKLCVMDQDGGNYQCLTDGSHLVLTPRFSPNLQQVIYMSYANGLPRLYLLDMPTGKQSLLGDFEGLNSSPRFSPDGKSVAMTLTSGHAGNPEIYTMNLNTRKLRRLTFHRGIDTSPSFSPDGSKIVFNSSRGGRPALYIMDRDGSNVKRLTFGNGGYYAPVWSPTGDLIAFVKELSGKFHIGVIDPNGKEERLLTNSYLDESPTWSPNGRVINFSRQQYRSDRIRLWSVDLTGYNLRELKTPSNASDPAWSPLVK